MSATRVGWLGGSFDPVHEGHLSIARAAADAFGLERVLLVPARRPPHKLDKQLADAEQRLQLLELATADDPRLEACDIELQREGPSYSFDTARALRELLGPHVELLFVIGADTLEELPSWHRIGELLQLVSFCPVTRDGSSLDVSALQDHADAACLARIAAHALHTEPHPASSTAIRAQLARGETPEHLPPAVLAAIRARGLYGAGGASSTDASSNGNS